MDDSPPSLSDIEAAEEANARKKEIIAELRALVASPGWAYLCRVMEQERLRLLLSLKSAPTQDELIRVNLDLREAETYLYLSLAPQNIIVEFTQDVEGTDEHPS